MKYLWTVWSVWLIASLFGNKKSISFLLGVKIMLIQKDFLWHEEGI